MIKKILCAALLLIIPLIINSCSAQTMLNTKLAAAKKGFVHVDPKKIEKILRDEGGAAGMDPFLKEFGDGMKDDILKALEGMPNVGQHEDGDYILSDDEEVKVEK